MEGGASEKFRGMNCLGYGVWTRASWRVESRGRGAECESQPNYIAPGKDMAITFPLMRGRRAEHAGRVNNQRVKGVYNSKGKMRS